MASCAPFLLLVFCCCCCSGKTFISLVCDEKNTGLVAHQSTLTCKVETSQEIPDLMIAFVAWKKKEGHEYKLLSALDKRPGYNDQVKPGYNITLNNRIVSLIITDTKVKDEGDYMCMVGTSSGSSEMTINLKVTAKYEAPKVNSSDGKDFPKAHKTLICKATGGYPKGELRWFDKNKTEWTKSAALTVNEMEDGLLELTSKLPLKEKSTFEEYTCVVYNVSGAKEGSATIRIDNKRPDPWGQDPSKTSAIIAPVLVIGSLIVGLLMALIIFRRRSQRQNRRPSTAPLMGTHDMVPHSHQEIDPPPCYCEENKDSMA